MARKHASSFSFPFGFYSDLARASWRAGEIILSSAEVIGYRSQMIAGAMSGEIAHDDIEFTRMWEEKVAAGLASMAAMWQHAPAAALGAGGMEAWSRAQMRALEAMTSPYHRKVTANAKRLRKKRSAS